MPKTAPPQVARHLRARRTDLQLTQQELAQELNVTHQHISRIEGGQAVPSLELLVKLSQRLGVSTDYLLTGKKTAPQGPVGAIRGDQRLTPNAKRYLIGIITELGGTT